MADQYIQVPADSTGKKVDTLELTVNSQVVQRQRVQIGGATDTAIAAVDATQGLATNPTDRALRDNGKVDVALLDQYTPQDVDTGAGTDNALPVALRMPASGGGVNAPGDAANGLDVDVTRLPALVAGSANIGDVDVLTLPALPAGANNIGDVDVVTVPAPLSTTGAGTVATALRTTLGSDDPAVVALQVIDNMIAGNEAQVDIVTVPAPLNVVGNGAASTAQRVTLANDSTGLVVASQPTAASLKCEPAGNVAHDAADSGNPIKIGARAVATIPTAVSAADRTDLLADLIGRLLIMQGNYINVNGVSLEVKRAEINATASGDTQVLAAVSGKQIRIVSVTFACSAAVAVSWKSASTTIVNAMSFAANGGMTEVWAPHGYFAQGGTNEILYINLSATASVRGVINYVEV